MSYSALCQLNDHFVDFYNDILLLPWMLRSYCPLNNSQNSTVIKMAQARVAQLVLEYLIALFVPASMFIGQQLIDLCKHGRFFPGTYNHIHIDVDGVYECRTKLLCPHLQITLRWTKLLKFLTQHFTTTSGSLQLCSKITYNILTVPKFIQSSFKCVSDVSRNNPVR